MATKDTVGTHGYGADEINAAQDAARRVMVAFYSRQPNDAEVVRRYDEMDIKMRQLTGFYIEDLIDLFAAGYTLEPPRPQQSLKWSLEKICRENPEMMEEKEIEWTPDRELGQVLGQVPWMVSGQVPGQAPVQEGTDAQ